MAPVHEVMDVMLVLKREAPGGSTREETAPGQMPGGGAGAPTPPS